MKTTLNKKALSSWIWVVLCSILIFVTVPVAQTIQKFVSKNLGKSFFIYFVLSVLALAFMSLLYFLIFKLNVRSAPNYIWLFILTGIYSYFTLKLVKTPPEAIHFLEYGLLGFFLFKALKYHIRDKSIYFTATFFALFVGTFDEILQWTIPQRQWDFHDVGLNALSGGLFQLVLWKVIKPKIISEKINPKSFLIFTSIVAPCLIILGLCASNTPQRVASYTKRIPFLSFLQKEEPMSEFGHKFKDPEIGVFYSRLTPKKLEKIDKLRGNEYAQVLNKSANMDYGQFLRGYNPFSNPFLHEFRVHVFRRDKYLKDARKTSKLNKKKEFYLIAYKENLILEKYFSNSIKKSIYIWNEDIFRELDTLIDKSKPYESPVSANLFTSFSEKIMWISIFALILSLILINFIFPYIKKQHKANNL